MAMTPERSKPPLHNFSLPCLKWGTQRLLRCVNADPPSSSDPDRRSDPAPRLPNRKTDDTTVDAVREKIMGDLRVAAKKLKVSIFEDDGGGGTAAANAAAARPWNLRTRRAACKAPVTGPPPRDEERRFFEVGCSSPSPAKDKDKDKNKKKMVMDEKIKFSVSLSKEEVEQDFWALAGTRPPRRPKKRPRNVQKQLTTLYPGLWLSEITADSYKVADVPE